MRTMTPVAVGPGMHTIVSRRPIEACPSMRCGEPKVAWPTPGNVEEALGAIVGEPMEACVTLREVWPAMASKDEEALATSVGPPVDACPRPTQMRRLSHQPRARL